MAFSRPFCVQVQGKKKKKMLTLSFYRSFTRYLYGILFKLFILVYNIEITSICGNLNFNKMYALFGENSFSPEIMVV